MNKEEAEEYAKNMTYRDAVCNALQGKCVPYRKATLIKLYELLDRLEQDPCEDAISRQAVLDVIDREFFIWDVIYEVRQLPPVNPQPSKDCVDRNSVELLAYRYLKEPTDNHVAFYEELLDLPPVNPQPKMGRWISDAIQGQIDSQIVKGFICSECGAISVFRMTDGKIVNGDLCPNCGAKMQECRNEYR